MKHAIMGCISQLWATAASTRMAGMKMHAWTHAWRMSGATVHGASTLQRFATPLSSGDREIAPGKFCSAGASMEYVQQSGLQFRGWVQRDFVEDASEGAAEADGYFKLDKLREAYPYQRTREPRLGTCKNKSRIQCPLEAGEAWNPMVTSLATDGTEMLQAAGALKDRYSTEVRAALDSKWPEVLSFAAEIKLCLEKTTYKCLTNWGHPVIYQVGFFWHHKEAGTHLRMYKICINGEQVYMRTAALGCHEQGVLQICVKGRLGRPYRAGLRGREEGGHCQVLVYSEPSLPTTRATSGLQGTAGGRPTGRSATSP